MKFAKVQFNHENLEVLEMTQISPLVYKTPENVVFN
jgi:hypothetical protein